MLYNEIVQQVAEVSGRNQATIARAFEEAAVTSTDRDGEIYRAAGLEPPELRMSTSAWQVLQANIRNTKGHLDNITMTTSVATQQQYIGAVNLAAMQIQTGALDYATAIRAAIQSAGEAGAQVLYPSGHRDSMDVAVRRAVLTGVNQTASQISLTNAQNFGCDLVETTAHPGARPTHAEWQGKVFSISGQSPQYSPFAETTGYGTGPGLCGWNCRHSFYPYFGDLSSRAYPQEVLQEYENKRMQYNGESIPYYDATQRQRAMERSIRATKRELAGLDEGIRSATDDRLRRSLQQEFNATAAKLKRQEGTLRDYLQQTGLRRDSTRVQVAGFGRSEAQKAVHAARKSGIIKTGRDAMRVGVEIDEFTPCLIERATGQVVQTQYAQATAKELKGLRKKGWLFDWTASDLADATVYKLEAEGHIGIQGLVAITPQPRDYAVYVNIAESAPQNRGENKIFKGVGGHLFAIAAQQSRELGYGGFLYMDAKNQKLVAHYRDKLGAVLIGTPHVYRMAIDEAGAQNLLRQYSL